MYNGRMSLLYRITDWIARLAFLNLIWILFTLLGLGVFGVFPATVGLYTVARQWILKKTDIPVWKTFWDAYRKTFIKANIIGVIVLIIGWVLQIDLRFFQTQGDSIIYLILSYFSILMFILYMIFLLFLFPVIVNYELKTMQYLKQTFLIVMLRPMEAMMAAAGFILVYYFMSILPVLIFFFGMSTLAMVTMWSSNRAFTKLQFKIENEKGKGYVNHV